MILLAISTASWAETQKMEIGNGLIRATLFPPDPVNGFYKGTRFDWSGIIGHLEYAGHSYYGPWFTDTDPTVRDFVFDGQKIVAGPCSAITGPSEEFVTNGQALGFEEASPGGTFIKIGVGVLRKPDGQKYDAFRQYQIVDHGKWSVRATAGSVEFTQRLKDTSSGYGYLYRKIVRLVPGQSRMIIEHHLTNMGTKTLATSVYDHNFLVLDKQPIGPDFVVTLPFEIRTKEPVDERLGEIQGKRILYRKTLENHERFSTAITGFGPTSKDYDIRIDNAHLGAGMRITADKPLESEELWSIRTILAMEPYIHMSLEPGQQSAWSYTYDYYTLEKK
jgi:hypothetical protein